MSVLVSGQPLTQWTRLTDNTLTTIFTASKRTTVVSIAVSETAGTAQSLTILRNDGTNNHYLRSGGNVTANQRVLIDEVLVLGAGDTIKAQSGDAAGKFHCTVTYLAPDAGANR